MRIIQNLLSNGIKYAKSQVVIELERAGSQSSPLRVSGSQSSPLRDEYGVSEIGKENSVSRMGELREPQYVISVTDDGKGIDKKNLQNIFTRYYKGEDGHFGIGLAVVKSSADYLGYKVEVDSEEEKGTTFIITI